MKSEYTAVIVVSVVALCAWGAWCVHSFNKGFQEEEARRKQA